MMETRYIRMNFQEALSAKKELLSAELNSLNIEKKLKKYSTLRKKEFALKRKLKIAFSGIKSKSKNFLDSLPKEELKFKKRRKKKSKEPEKYLQNELESIKNKLAEFN